MNKTTLAGAIGFFLVCLVAVGPFAYAQTHPTHPAQAMGPHQPNRADMMKMHEQMMADMKASEARLDALLKDMNAARGDAKVSALAAVVTQLVQDQKAMHAHFNQMHDHMMGAQGMMQK